MFKVGDKVRIKSSPNKSIKWYIETIYDDHCDLIDDIDNLELVNDDLIRSYFGL